MQLHAVIHPKLTLNNENFSNSAASLFLLYSNLPPLPSSLWPHGLGHNLGHASLVLKCCWIGYPLPLKYGINLAKFNVNTKKAISLQFQPYLMAFNDNVARWQHWQHTHTHINRYSRPILHWLLIQLILASAARSITKVFGQQTRRSS